MNEIRIDTESRRRPKNEDCRGMSSSEEGQFSSKDSTNTDKKDAFFKVNFETLPVVVK